MRRWFAMQGEGPMLEGGSTQGAAEGSVQGDEVQGSMQADMASILDLMADGLAYTLDRKVDMEQGGSLNLILCI
jgi:hypothetical protein